MPDPASTGPAAAEPPAPDTAPADPAPQGAVPGDPVPTEPAPGYRMLAEPPSVDEYRALRAQSGLSPKSDGQARGALTGTWAWRVVRDEHGAAAAMGRVLGDGGWYFLVADMATFPEHQGKGLGRAVLASLLAEIRERAEPGAYVTLTADPPGRHLYESVGFEDVAPARTGMSMLT